MIMNDNWERFAKKGRGYVRYYTNVLRWDAEKKTKSLSHNSEILLQYPTENKQT
jgi:hypothetical protein